MKAAKYNLKKTEKCLVMVSYEFGYPLYIAPYVKVEARATDKKEEAEIWSEFDTIKIEMAKYLTGYKLEWLDISETSL